MPRTRDAKGRFIKETPGTGGQTARIPLIDAGVTGLKQTGGFLQEEFHTRLRGRLADRIYAEMEQNNASIGAALWAMETLIRQVEWEVKPRKGQEDELEAKNLADWYEGARTDTETGWQDTISEIMSMPTYGWCLMEELYKVRRGPEQEEPRLHSQFDDGLWGWRDFSIRAQDSRWRWEFQDDTGKVLGMWQQVRTEGKLRFVPMEKALLFRLRSRHNSPEGRSLLRPCYRPAYMLKRTEEVEGVSLERDGAGLPVFTVPWQILHPDASPAEKALKNLTKEVVQKTRIDATSGLVIPGPLDKNGQQTGFEFKLMSASGKNHGATDTVIKRYRQDIMIALLSEFLLLGTGPTGSYALASEQTNVMAMALGAMLDTVSTVFTDCAFRRLGRLNRFPPRSIPVLTHGDIEKADFLRFSQAMANLVNSGILTPDNPLEDDARQRGMLPVREEGRALRETQSIEVAGIPEPETAIIDG
ncbi:MAG: hypothetical protein GTO22_14345 [Gemmatimonadales bacterium]|nr:hypothetical protein [Gemmatimonadales bacterium]